MLHPRALLTVFLFLFLLGGPQARASYTVVVSKQTNAMAGWGQVVKTLVEKHNAALFVFDKSVTESLADLRKHFPRYTCFVATSKEATGAFVAEVHRLTRKLDEDPYTDTLWGILTGYDAKNALAIAQHQTPLTVRKVASGTELALECCVEGLWYDELVKNKMVRKKPGGVAEQLRGPDDTTEVLVDTLNRYKADLYVEKDDEVVDGKSIMGLMMLAAGNGSTLQFTAEGKDCEAVLADLETLFESEFTEG